MRSSSLTLIALVLLALFALSTEVGRILGRRQRAKDRDKDASGLATGMLGIFALLIAFTYSLSLARYDARRNMVLEEANAIGTTANYATMLPQQHRVAVLALLRRYTQLRLDLVAPYDEAGFARDIASANLVLNQLWAEASAVTAEQPQSLPAYRFVSALNEQTNIGEARVTALRNHVPVTVLVVVTLTAMLSLGFTGYSTSLDGYNRYVGLAIMAAALTLLMVLTIDLDRPDRGSIEISKQPLIDALQTLPPG